MKKLHVFLSLIGLSLTGCSQPVNSITSTSDITMQNDSFQVQKTEEEWKSQLSPEQYTVLRQKGTEAPYSGKYYLATDSGIYVCAACGNELFTSAMKFDAHCGWPSFDKEIEGGRIIQNRDTSHGMVRTEIICGKCGSHLGHIFDDGPTETGMRYCVNSVSLDFKESGKK